MLRELRWPQVALGALCLWIGAWLMFREVPEPVAPPLPDFSQFGDVTQLKRAFFDYLTPVVVRENAKILALRQRLEDIEGISADQWRASERRFLKSLANDYRIEVKEIDGNLLKSLLKRVDQIPLELALVQAAKESGWGRSRFAVRANNLFGQWCYVKGCGLVPANRPAGATHEVQKFESVDDAIASYLLNLNSHPSYESLRDIRARLRRQGEPITGIALTPGLLKYSQRRQAYVQELNRMIISYRRFQDKLQGREPQ